MKRVFYFCCSHCGEQYSGTDMNHVRATVYHVHFQCGVCGEETELYVEPKDNRPNPKEVN
jgi:transcription elongation factor Elf1